MLVFRPTLRVRSDALAESAGKQLRDLVELDEVLHGSGGHRNDGDAVRKQVVASPGVVRQLSLLAVMFEAFVFDGNRRVGPKQVAGIAFVRAAPKVAPFRVHAAIHFGLRKAVTAHRQRKAQQQGERRFQGRRRSWDEVTPVSYTHLDVYKRQVVSSTKAYLNALNRLLDDKQERRK